MTVSEQLQSWPDYCHWQTWGLGAARWKSRAVNRFCLGIFYRRIFYLPFVLNSKTVRHSQNDCWFPFECAHFGCWARWDAGSHQAPQRQLAVRLCVCVDVQSSGDKHGLHHPNPDKELFFRRCSDTWSATWVPFRPLSHAPRPSPATSAVRKVARASWPIRGFFPESQRCFLCWPHPRPLSPWLSDASHQIDLISVVSTPAGLRPGFCHRRFSCLTHSTRGDGRVGSEARKEVKGLRSRAALAIIPWLFYWKCRKLTENIFFLFLRLD